MFLRLYGWLPVENYLNFSLEPNLRGALDLYRFAKILLVRNPTIPIITNFYNAIYTIGSHHLYLHVYIEVR